MTDKELMERFNAEMERRKYTVDQAAEAINVSRSTYFHWQRTGTISKRGRLAMATFVPSTQDKLANTPVNDPFFKIILDNWSKLTPEDQGRLAGIVRGMVESNPAPAHKLHCPICHVELPAEWKDGETNECPNCKQHIRIEP